MAMLAPSDEDECRKALSTAFARNHPVAVRYPRGAGIGKRARVPPTSTPLPWGKAELRRQVPVPVAGKRVAILAFGTLLYAALQAGEASSTPAWPTCVSSNRIDDRAAAGDWPQPRPAGDGGRRLCARAVQAARWPKAWPRPSVSVNTPLMHAGSARCVRRARRAGQAASRMCGLDAEGIEQSVRERRAQLAGD
jgi:1-deoxy-D-xylulose-5-phosphate synthase